jgi:DNA-binding CsgD family transcriptional regulator
MSRSELWGRPVEAATALSYETDGLQDWHLVLDAVRDLMGRAICSDEIVWQGVDPRHARVSVQGESDGQSGDPDEIHLLLDLDDHPVKNHFASHRDQAAVRLSDLTTERDFRATRTWADLFKPRGVQRQLTIPTAFGRHGAGSGWTLNRSGSDFTDEDLRTASTVQPLLIALETSAHWHPDPDDARRLGAWGPWVSRAEADDPAAAARDHAELTARETEVLTLVGTGLTAQAGAHRLRISVKTVRKHLEHIYDKIGKHDRLLAMRYAESAGIIPARRAPG